MFTQIGTRLRPLLLPFLCIASSVGLILVLKGLTIKASKSADSMQVEMNQQFDRFQKQLVESDDALVDMQKRMILSDHVRDRLNSLFVESQDELKKTQAALAMTNVALVHTQKALADIVEALRDSDRTSDKVRSADSAAILAISDSSTSTATSELFSLCVGRLKRIKAAIADTRLAIQTESANVNEQWKISEALALRLSNLERPSTSSVKPLREVDGQEHRNTTSGSTLDLTPKTVFEADENDQDKSGGQSVAFIYNRIDERTQELLALNNELSGVHSMSSKLETLIREQLQRLNALRLEGLSLPEGASRN
jgi:hypothetical protein